MIFTLRLTEKEWTIIRSQIVPLKGENLKSQIATSSWGDSRKSPHAFTEHGILMLSSVLHSDIAVDCGPAAVKNYRL
jgi:hypothetical protein